MEKTKIDLTAELEEIKRGQQQTLDFLKSHGQELDLGEWLSVRDYAKKYGVSIQVVVNWINRGIIPADCVEDLLMFNNIRMVQDKVYK
ncbi:helix-turn-helix domain-containing protein [Larkinella humicola]|uniref:Helix-turn-helix domain-containing protein n=1 Tax=Larkinella humicola TaxID=2607654 RepID=A0A5N1JB75_9BACT|nr:helix-turn-helix domain-containing protein [Larkinella humicola]KAA9349034.1 helix-turn-helix domain-containing protein [Larkinella humicola]